MTIPTSVAAMLVTSVNAPQPQDEAQDSPLRILWDLRVSPRTGHVTQWLAERGWCWAIEAPPHIPDQLLTPLREAGFQIVGQLHAHPETRAWHWKCRGMSTPDVETFIRQLRNLKGDKTRVQFFIEDDSAGVGFSSHYLHQPPATHAEAMNMLDAYLEAAMAETKVFPDVSVWAIAGFAGAAHHYTRHGAQCVIIERANDDVEDLQTAIAFARGAARQFGGDWGIDLSLWWGVIYGCVHDLPASLYTRHLWLAYMGGARALCIEGGDLLVRSEGPTEVARAIDAFAQTARHITPGEVDAPVAVLLPRDHGWMTPAYWRTTNEAWNYARIPYRQGDRGVDGFFGAAYPGAVYAQDPYPKGAYGENEPPASPFALSCITPEFAPTPEQRYCAEPPIAFGQYRNREDARQDFYENNIDPSPYRPMGDSRWGDILDVLTDDASLDVMTRYKVIVLLGQIPLTPVLREALIAHARAGGKVVVAAGVVGPNDEDLCGVVIQPELRVGRAWRWGDGTLTHEAFRYCPIHIPEHRVSTVTPLASTPDGKALAIRYALGDGAVYCCLAPWFEAGNTPLSLLALRLLDEIIRPVQPVRVSGPPAAWLSTRDAEAGTHRTVVITNNNEHSWEGSITAVDIPEGLNHCRELISEETVDFVRNGPDATATLTIEAYGVRVLRWQTKSRRDEN